MFHATEIVNGSLIVMDADGTILDAFVLRSLRRTKQTIQAWTSLYTIDVASAYRMTSEWFSIYC